MLTADTTRAALLAAVCAAPDDDLPRLQFADFLDDAGEGEHAEFIRCQIEFAAIIVPVQHCTGDPNCLACRAEKSRHALRRREWELLSAVQDAIKAEWMAWAPDDGCWWEAWAFRRGFVEEVTCNAADWVRKRDVIRAATPLRKVTATDLRWPDFIGTRFIELPVRVDDFRPVALVGELGPSSQWSAWRLERRDEGRLYDGNVEIVPGDLDEIEQILHGTGATGGAPYGVISHPTHIAALYRAGVRTANEIRERTS